MSGDRYLLDMNIVILLLSGNNVLTNLLEQRTLYISGLTIAEFHAKPGLEPKGEKVLDAFAESVIVVHTHDFIVKKAGGIKRSNKMKLPDAVIAATALYLDLP
jgi:predicted nucleic acid-binding protein